jgi:membrane-bound lytic murein transglycosylase D
MAGRLGLAAALLACGLLAGCAQLSAPFAAAEPESAQARPDADAAALAQGGLERSLGEEPGDLPQEPGSSEARADGPADLLERMRAGFALPPVDDLRVRRQLDWYAARPDYLARCFERGRRYLHHIVQELEARNLPRELALLPVVESAFDPFAHSPRRASGLWQFIPSTGRHYGLEQDGWLDGRRDVRAATRAALDHLEDLHQQFEGDWLLALAGYNAGAGGVRRAIEKNLRRGRPTDFFHLDLLPETRAYVPKLLALAQLAAEPERFGIELPAIPDDPYFARVDVGGQIDLGVIAELAQISLDELRALNPQYKRWATAPEGPHELLVPAAAGPRMQEALASLPESRRLRYALHRVRRGDTLIAIAGRYGVPVEALRTTNRVRGSLIHPGQELLVPLSSGRMAVQPEPARGASS